MKDKIGIILILFATGFNVPGQNTVSEALKRDLASYFTIQKNKIGFNGAVLTSRGQTFRFKKY